MNQYTRLADIILSLEAAMREQEIWDEVQPSSEALSSSQPFCIDTLSFSQWLQFIFIDRMKFIIEQEGALPASSEIVPMAEEYFGQTSIEAKHIIEALVALDDLINAENSAQLASS